MFDALWFSIWFFLPAGISNVSPIILKKVPFLQSFTAPLDGGRTWHGKRLFGPNKTWRGLIGGTLLALLTILLQSYLFQHFSWAQTAAGPIDYTAWYIPYLGLLLGVGALLGDAIESMFKRQKNIAPGQSWMPFDQLDYIFGALLCSLLVVRLSLGYYLLMLVVWFLIHILSTYVGFKLKFKDAPI